MKIFIEEQKFTQWWIMLLIVGLSLIGPIAIFLDWESIRSEGFGGIIAIVLGGGLPLVFLLMFLYLKLITRIDEFGIHYKFFPLHWAFKTISWQNIATCELRKYNAIKEYGGWGVKHSLRKKTGKSYTVKGSNGLQIVLKSGKKILIGTQLKDDIQRCLSTYEHKIYAYGQ